jgi:hypothetical protein
VGVGAAAASGSWSSLWCIARCFVPKVHAAQPPQPSFLYSTLKGQTYRAVRLRGEQSGGHGWDVRHHGGALTLPQLGVLVKILGLRSQPPHQHHPQPSRLALQPTLISLNQFTRLGPRVLALVLVLRLSVCVVTLVWWSSLPSPSRPLVSSLTPPTPGETPLPYQRSSTTRPGAWRLPEGEATYRGHWPSDEATAQRRADTHSSPHVGASGLTHTLADTHSCGHLSSLSPLCCCLWSPTPPSHRSVGLCLTLNSLPPHLSPRTTAAAI